MLNVHSRGTGRLEADDNTAEVSYHLDEYEERVSIAIPGWSEIRGTVKAISGELPRSGSVCVLHLQDSRKIKVTVTSSTGQVVATGGFF